MLILRVGQHRRKTGGGPDPSVGLQEWYRQAEWFNNENGYRPSGHVVLPFATKTIRRGLQRLAATPMLDRRRSVTDPSGRRLQRARNIYRNRFHEVGAGAEIIDLESYLSKTG